MPAIRSPLRPAIRSALRSPLDYNYGGGFNPASLYAGGKLGLWYEPSDLSTGYQDSAGTTPAALNDFIGKRLDKSGRGNHALQATSGARPTYSARVNGLLSSDGHAGGTITPGTGLVVMATGQPDSLGGNTARQIRNTTTNEQHRLFTPVSGVGRNSYFVDIKNVDAGWIHLSMNGAVQTVGAYFNVATGAVGTRQTSGAAATSSIASLGGGWYRCQLNAPSNETSVTNVQLYILESDIGSINPFVVQTAKSVYVGAAQLAPFGTTTYQRVNTASDYDTVGFPTFLNFDGVNDALSTGAITLGADMDCFIAVRRSSATGILAYTTPGSGVYFGAFDATGSAASAGAGTPTYYVNGVAVPGGTSTTRTQLATALPVGVWSVLEIRNANLSAWTAFANGAYTGFITAEDEAGIILCEAQSTASRNQIRTYLGTKVGLVL